MSFNSTPNKSQSSTSEAVAIFLFFYKFSGIVSFAIAYAASWIFNAVWVSFGLSYLFGEMTPVIVTVPVMLFVFVGTQLSWLLLARRLKEEQFQTNEDDKANHHSDGKPSKSPEALQAVPLSTQEHVPFDTSEEFDVFEYDDCMETLDQFEPLDHDDSSV